jgi:DNA-directed RNA polymerase specialized sigma24 family protein
MLSQTKKEDGWGRKEEKEKPDANIEMRPGPKPISSKDRWALAFYDECKDRLPERERLIFELRFIEDKGIKEIAQVVKAKLWPSSLGYIENKIESARKKVEECVKAKMLLAEDFFENKSP